MHLFLDIETFYDPENKYTLEKMSCVEYCRDARFKFHGVGFAYDDGAVQWVSKEAFAGFMAVQNWAETDVVSHNAKFDWFAIKTYYNVNPRSYIDTKGMSRAVFGKTIKNHSLATLAEHFSLPSKGTMKTAGIKDLTLEQEAELAEYCKHDVWLCREIFNRLKKDFPSNQYATMSQTIDMFVTPQLKLNVEVLKNASQNEKERRENIFKEIGIEKETFASNIKFPELLKARGYIVPFKPSPRKLDKDGKPLLIPALALGDVEFLNMLEGSNEELKTLCEARVAAKSTLLETRTTKLALIGQTGSWPFDVEFSGADQTHRFSGGSGAGGNPQNFTRDSALREAVEAPKGTKLIVGDFAQVEFRNVAYLSRDLGLLQIVENNEDPYCQFASKRYGRTITKADKLERKFGKECQLALPYNMGAKKFKARLKINTGQIITEEEAWETVNLYRTTYSGVKALWDDLAKFIPLMTHKDTRLAIPQWPITFIHEAVLLPSGLPIRFPNLHQEMGERGKMEWVYEVWIRGKLEKKRLYGGKLLENISQGLAGEYCKLAMQKFEGYVMGQIHDELILVVPEDEAEIAAERLEEVMSESPPWFKEIKLAAEVKVGRNWRETK